MDSLTRGIERACALHPGIRCVSVSSQKLIIATKQLQLEQTHRQTHTCSQLYHIPCAATPRGITTAFECSKQ